MCLCTPCHSTYMYEDNNISPVDQTYVQVIALAVSMPKGHVYGHGVFLSTPTLELLALYHSCTYSRVMKSYESRLTFIRKPYSVFFVGTQWRVFQVIMATR